MTCWKLPDTAGSKQQLANMFRLKKFFYNNWYKHFPPEMVKYWKTKECVRAKVTQAKEGHYIMWMEGEKYPFPGFPRGDLLYGKLSPLKHQIKNKIFNESWALLGEGKPVDTHIKSKLDEIIEMFNGFKYDTLPESKLVPAVKELWRAWTVIGGGYKSQKLKEIMCFILQEDDGYRFRVQWVMGFFSFWQKLLKINPIKTFEYALSLLEHAEVIGDMKERQRLLKRVCMEALKDPIISELFTKLFREIDFKKMKLSKADKYFFRAKYFKTDYPNFDY